MRPNRFKVSRPLSLAVICSSFLLPFPPIRFPTTTLIVIHSIFFFFFFLNSQKRLTDLQRVMEDLGAKLHEAELVKSQWIPVGEISFDEVSQQKSLLKVRLMGFYLKILFCSNQTTTNSFVAHHLFFSGSCYSIIVNHMCRPFPGTLFM